MYIYMWKPKAGTDAESHDCLILIRRGRVSLLNSELINMSCLASQLVLQIPFLCLPGIWD